jgi:RNA polymerase sigma-70 factor, ECF subfamily
MSESNPISEAEFLPLFVKNEEALRAHARVLLPNWEAVDEVLQQASVVMWKKLSQLEDADEFLPWAKVIVRFESLRLRRSFARDRHVFSDEVVELLANELADVDEETFERERWALQHCLQQLPEHHRELVLAAYEGGGRVTRLAEEAGRTVNSLYKLMGRLREKLAQCIELRIVNGGPV